MMKCLPLKEDFEEYQTAIDCLTMLYQTDNTEVIKNAPQVLRVLVECICSKGLAKGGITAHWLNCICTGACMCYLYMYRVYDKLLLLFQRLLPTCSTWFSWSKPSSRPHWNRYSRTYQPPLQDASRSFWRRVGKEIGWMLFEPAELAPSVAILVILTKFSNF